MTVSSGFFNSVNHDRLYDAEQFGSLFDGIINDGVYEHVGDAFEVTPNSDVNDSVIVGTGRAWFNHTWILNNAQYSITLNPPNLVAPRYDAIVLDIDRRDSVRKNSIVVVEGTPASDPQYPSMVNEELHSQYPIAYIRMNPGNSDIISASDITYNVGNSSCPLVTGPLEVINDDNFFSQMNASFTEFKNDLDEEFTTWFEGIKELIEDLNIGNINLVNSVDNVTIEWPSDTKKLQVKDRGITRNKLSFDLQSIIGVLDPTGWSFQDYYDYTNSLTSSGEEETFTTQYLTSSSISNWTSEQIISYYGILKSNTSKNKLWSSASLEKYSILEFRDILQTFGSGKYSSSIGKKFKVDLGDTYGVHNFVLLGINADTLASGGNAFMTFQSEDVVARERFIFSGTSPSTPYSDTPLCDFVENLIEYFPSDLKAEIKSVTKKQWVGSNLNNASVGSPFNSKIWIMSSDGMFNIHASNYKPDNLYDYWSSFAESSGSTYSIADSKSDFISVDNTHYNGKIIKKYAGTPCDWVLREYKGGSYPGPVGAHYALMNKHGYRGYTETSMTYDAYYDFSKYGDSDYSGSFGSNTQLHGNMAGIVPCFCV